MAFGDVAFSGSRFIFWCAAPVLALCAVGVPLLVDTWTPLKLALAAAWSLACLAAILALYDARRFWLAARTVTAAIFLAYLAYVIDQVLLSGKPIEPTRRSDLSPWNSILRFIIIGVPALWYTLFGRFRPHRSPRAGTPRSYDSELKAGTAVAPAELLLLKGVAGEWRLFAVPRETS